MTSECFLQLKYIWLLILLTPTAWPINVNTTVVTTIQEAKIELIDGNKCCCDAKLWKSYHLFYESFNCSQNTDCNMCRSFNLTELLPYQNYGLRIIFANSSQTTLYFTTKPLRVRLVPKISGSNAVILVKHNYTGKVYSCFFTLMTSGKNVDSCTSSCPDCSKYSIEGLEDNKTYTLTYKNDYMENSQSLNFAIEAFNFKLSMKEGFTFVLLSVTSDLVRIKKCTISIRNTTNVISTFNRTTCQNFTAGNFRPDEEYLIDVSINDLKPVKTRVFKTENLFINQNAEQTFVDEVRMVVTTTANPIEHSVCEIVLDQTLARCKETCPTDCGNFTIILNTTKVFTVKIQSNHSKYGSSINVYPKKLNFKEKNTFYSNGLLYTTIEPNLKNAGNCILKAFINNTEVQMVCKNSQCPINCDRLNLVLENMPIHTEIKFSIRNRFLEDDVDLVVIGDPIIYVDKNITVGITTVNITVTSDNTSICCCRGDLKKRYSLFYIYRDCDGDEDCRNCRSFTIRNLLPGNSYIYYYYVTNGTYTEFYFEPKYSEATLGLNPQGLSLIAAVKSNYQLTRYECSFGISLEGKVIEACTGTCESCYNHKFSNLTVGTQYTVYYNNNYLKERIYQSETTPESQLEFSLNVEKNFHSALVIINANTRERGYCVVAVQDSRGSDIDAKCSYNEDCKTCKSFSLFGLQPGEQYEVKLTFMNHRKSKFINITTDSITITQSYKQIELLKIKVTVRVETTSHDIYSCFISFNTSKAMCEGSCPTDCTEYIVVLKSKVGFKAKITSKEASLISVIEVKPAEYNVSLISTSIKGTFATFVFQANFFKGGSCYVEFWSSKQQIIPDCNFQKCSQDCDSLTLNVSNLYTYSSVDIIVKNDNLQVPFFKSVSLDYGVLLEEIETITKNSVSLKILHGNKCCCNATLLLKRTQQSAFASCEDDEACRYCKSFNITNLLPNTNYQLELTIPTSKTIVRYFKTEPIFPFIIVKVGFNYVVVTVKESYSNKTNQCKFEVKIQNIISSSCDENCPSCYMLYIYPIKLEDSYSVAYRNIFMRKTQEISFRTIAPSYKIPKVVYVIQIKPGMIKFTINNDAKYNYTANYRIYKLNNSTKTRKSENIKYGKFDNTVTTINVDVSEYDSAYHGVFCFKVNDDLCLRDPTVYTCTECDDLEFNVCSAQHLYPEGGTLSVSTSNVKIVLVYDNTFLSCHNEMECIFGFLYVLRKTPLNNVTHLSRKTLLERGMERNLYFYHSLKPSECLKTNTVELSDQASGRIALKIQKSELYFTTVIALCGTEECLMADYMKDFKIPNPRISDLVIFAAFGILGLIALILSIVLVFCKEPDNNFLKQIDLTELRAENMDIKETEMEPVPYKAQTADN